MNKTRVCIVGAGAIGGLIGARLALAGACDVSALARGETLAALRRHGWRIGTTAEVGTAQTAAVAAAAEQASQLGPQDLVVIALKGQAVADMAPRLAPLLHESTVVLPALNGVPWWFGQGLAELGAEPLQSVDPGGAVSRALPAARVLGCVVHASASRAEPGFVVNAQPGKLIVGEADRGLAAAPSARLEQTAALLRGAGFEIVPSTDIRRDLWYKLWGNLTMNPVSAITGATADRVLADPLVRAFCTAAMAEAAQIGARIGCAIDQTPTDRHSITAKLGAFKTSMLQDVEAGRPIELDAIVGAVSEIGQRLGVATPNIDALLGLTRLFARSRGLYPLA
jgi:2-dehydropantoate 2-reductase